MAWKNILILLVVIASVHLVIIFGVSGGCRDKNVKKQSETPHQTEAAENFPAPVPEKNLYRAEPWKFGQELKLPSALAKQSEKAKSAIIVDLASRKVLWEKKSRQKVAIASLTKLMTVLLTAEKLEKDPDLKENTIVAMSRSAASTAYRKYDAGDRFTIKDLISAAMIQSANDAAAMLAETVGGSEEKFVRLMNERAFEIGLEQADFNSPHGLPVGKNKENSCASAADVLFLCEALMDYPLVMDICGESAVKLSNGREIYTTNGLLLYPRANRPYYRKVPGMIGFKTGFTNEAGCCLAFGVTRDGKTVLGCVTGFPSAADRERFCSDLIEWAYKTGEVTN